jgi:hypothetical protein
LESSIELTLNLGRLNMRRSRHVPAALKHNQLVQFFEDDCVSKGLAETQRFLPSITLHADVEALREELRRRLALVPEGS